MHNTAHNAHSYTQAHTAQACVRSVVHSCYTQCAVDNAAQHAIMRKLNNSKAHTHAQH